MKKSHFFSAPLLVLLFFLSPGCKKFDDLFEKDKLVVTGCDIYKIHLPAGFDYSGSEARTAVVRYNALGQPISMIFENTQDGTGYPNNYFFRYDAEHRLTDFIAAYDNGAFDTWHTYRYNGKGQVKDDSAYFFGELNGGHPSETDLLDRPYTVYTYDDIGRIIKAVVIRGGEDGPSSFDTSITNYTYNSDGNLVRPGSMYDKQVNMNRTNKIWMFINRDYSRNNFRAALQYNEKKLPLEFTAGNLPFSLFNYQGDTTDGAIDNIQVEYNCESTEN